MRVLPISEKYADYAEEVNRVLKRNGILSTVDNRSEKIGYKIREARLAKIPYMLVVGAKEQEEGSVFCEKPVCRRRGTETIIRFYHRYL